MDIPVCNEAYIPRRWIWGPPFIPQRRRVSFRSCATSSIRASQVASLGRPARTPTTTLSLSTKRRGVLRGSVSIRSDGNTDRSVPAVPWDVLETLRDQLLLRPHLPVACCTLYNVLGNIGVLDQRDLGGDQRGRRGAVTDMDADVDCGGSSSPSLRCLLELMVVGSSRGIQRLLGTRSATPPLGALLGVEAFLRHARHFMSMIWGERMAG